MKKPAGAMVTLRGSAETPSPEVQRRIAGRVQAAIDKQATSVTLTMSRTRALELGLLTCTCGHPVNNHFSFDARPCAHCDCKVFDERGIAETKLEAR